MPSFTAEGADRLMDKIARYWAKQGYAVEFRLEKVSDPIAKRPLYFVRSDMINGWPRGKAIMHLGFEGYAPGMP
jgi:hypothetical protein